jgi:hypothetical protein
MNGIMVDGFENIGGTIEWLTSIFEKSLGTPTLPDSASLMQAEEIQLVQHYEDGLDQREKIGIISHSPNNSQVHVMYLALNDAEIR